MSFAFKYYKRFLLKCFVVCCSCSFFYDDDDVVLFSSSHSFTDFEFIHYLVQHRDDTENKLKPTLRYNYTIPNTFKFTVFAIMCDRAFTKIILIIDSVEASSTIQTRLALTRRNCEK